ncbi:MAG TPA: tetratricopeptide repeat protein [Anaerolineales bacterium]|nr:tetratricopeptide repeat protein [Anaerolineales bacterium]
MANPSINLSGHLPSGTVTFLFTDIEGSTRLLQQLGEKYTTLLEEHQQLLQEICENHHGSVVGTQGDSFFVAFSSAVDAIHAVVKAQRALNAHPWMDGVMVRVRMGLHTGEPQISSSGYVGIDVHRAARIAAAGYGGQVLLSQTTVDLIATELPDGVTLRDLGEHRLKDLRRPKHLYQLIITGLPSDFPPLKSLRAPNNLPVLLTSFIGRSSEIADIKQLLSDGRLLTLTGPGGSGKTRLALQVASELVDDFHDGVFFAALAPVTDPGLVASTIAQTLGVTETAGQPIVETLKDYLQSRTLLLLLDNFEQVIDSAPLAAQLLAACGQLKILVTSREALRIRGERIYPVPPLALPNLSQLPPEAIAQYAAVKLFIQRAQAVRPDFRVTNETAPVVAEICHRLEGLPLAIELAAARIKLLPPRSMLARLGKRLEFLTSGGRDLPARQQTLRDAIAWSYDLLEEHEQRLFRRISVFVGGCTVHAVEEVAGDDPAQFPILDQLGSLLDKSMLREVEDTDGGPRFAMLELLREFGLEQLEASGEQEEVRHRHVRFFLKLAEHAEAGLESPEQVEWMYRMEQEHDNLRAALDWSKSTAGTQELCLRLAAALGYFWEMHGHFSEGRERLSAILSKEFAQGQTAARARLLARAAELAYRQSDYPATGSFAEESLRIYRKLGDRQGIASMLIKLGNAATERGAYASASRFLEEALMTWRELKDKHGIARALISLGWAALRSGDHDLASTRLQEALTLSRQLGDARSMGFELSGLGEVALRQGDYARATQLMEESLEVRRQLGNKWGIGVSLGMLGWVAMRERDWERAIKQLGESLKVRQQIGDKGGSAWCLERLAGVAMAQGQAEKAVRLFGTAAALRSSIGSVIDPVDQARYKKNLNSLRKKLGKERYAAIWNEGRAMTMEQAIAYALQDAED